MAVLIASTVACEARSDEPPGDGGVWTPQPAMAATSCSRNTWSVGCLDPDLVMKRQVYGHLEGPGTVENAGDVAWGRPVLPSQGLQPSGGDAEERASRSRGLGLVASSELRDGGGVGQVRQEGRGRRRCRVGEVAGPRFTEDLLGHLKVNSVQGRDFGRVLSWRSAHYADFGGARLEGQGGFLALGRESSGRKEGREGHPQCRGAEEHSQPGPGTTR